MVESLYNILYNAIIVPLLYMLYAGGSLFLPKLKAKIHGEVPSWSKVPTKKSGVRRILFHAASVGEFEQCKPIIELLKQQHPATEVIVSFSSPSAYKTQQQYKWADAIVYAPFDSSLRVKQFLLITNPDCIVVDRYDLWWNFTRLTKQLQIPIHLINATYPSSLLWKYPFFRTYITLLLNRCTTITPINDYNKQKFNKLLGNTTVLFDALPDSRYDRLSSMLNTTLQQQIQQVLPQWFTERFPTIIVIGSSWKEDEDVILQELQSFQQQFNTIGVILVPHEPTPETIQQLLKSITHACILSNPDQTESNTIIVDSVGKLLMIYSVASAAYIGGGFGAGVHSVTEAAVYGIPVSCGPNIARNLSAIELQQRNGLVVCTTAQEFKTWLQTCVLNESTRQVIGSANREYILQQIGSSQKLLERILPL